GRGGEGPSLQRPRRGCHLVVAGPRPDGPSAYGPHATVVEPPGTPGTPRRHPRVRAGVRGGLCAEPPQPGGADEGDGRHEPGRGAVLVQARRIPAAPRGAARRAGARIRRGGPPDLDEHDTRTVAVRP